MIFSVFSESWHLSKTDQAKLVFELLEDENKMKGDKKGGPVAMEDDKHILFPSN